MLTSEADLTLGFDATTQEGIHVNSIHATSKDKCNILVIDQSPGGTAEDYEMHITNTIDRNADVYCAVHKYDFNDCKCKVISNIMNTMTDRAAVNHATISRLEQASQ